jgi:DNA-binding NtrC family response regulator
VGKERLARAVHAASRRADGPFISVNCGAIPENLLESHLFGHEKGSFTGAARAQRGCFELAHGGTLFLDEICEMPFHLQVKLLHVLQDFEVRPIGSEKAIAVNVRVVAATNRDIEKEVEEQRFRRDLYYRLSVVSVTVPPLRERREDIPTLAESFVEDLSARVGRKVRRISEQAMRSLCDYAWPGNVRELVNVLERAVLLCDGNEIAPRDLPEDVRAGGATRPAGEDAAREPLAAMADAWLDKPLRDGREAAAGEFEKAYLARLLSRTQGRIAETAQRAGIEPRSLFTKMKRHGLRKEDFKERRA